MNYRIQLDFYSCGAKSVYAILKYFKKRCSIGSLQESLRTNYYGTTIDNKLAFKELKKASLN